MDQQEHDLIKRLREEANEVKKCFTNFSFAAITFSSAVFAAIVGKVDKFNEVSFAAIPVVALLMVVCRIGIYKYSTANRNYGYELHLARLESWAEDLNYGGFEDWRLPTISPVNGTVFNFDWAKDGSTDSGFNITSPNSELMYMYYINLGNPGAHFPNGDDNKTTWGTLNTGDFINLYRSTYSSPPEAYYWSSNQKDSNYTIAANYFAGSQTTIKPNELAYAWAVRDGDVLSTPISGAALLLGSGLIGLIGLHRKLKN